MQFTALPYKARKAEHASILIIGIKAFPQFNLNSTGNVIRQGTGTPYLSSAGENVH